ncbi:transporter associated domain-containing protein [Bradyrhizobium sp. AZCC 1610]|uniref:transporter associated domain-containing protein n=1 Tax=Bradyrhizobium sp. AZCC 1610 TaxID=3117020 RepID=UPI002FF34501
MVRSPRFQPPAGCGRRLGATGDWPEGGDYHTIAGFAVFLLGRIPVVGDQFVWEGWRFEIADMDRQRINKLRVSRVSE